MWLRQSRASQGPPPKSEDIFTIAINPIPPLPASTPRYFTADSLRLGPPGFAVRMECDCELKILPRPATWEGLAVDADATGRPKRVESSQTGHFRSTILPPKKIKAAFIDPMLLLPTTKLPEGPNWTYELLCGQSHNSSSVALRVMWR
jgi:hypothetical protein